MSKAEVNEKTIAALLRERDALEGRGLDERVAQVDEELKNRGYKSEGKIAVKPIASPQNQPPQGRSATPKQQTTKD